MDIVTLKILVIEDDFVTAKSYELMLEKLGHTVELAKEFTIEEVERILIQFSPDMIFIDINLPNMISGIDLAKAINNIRDIPIIYITACSDDNTINDAKKTNPYGYLIKPVSFANIKASIEIAYTKSEFDFKIRESEQRYENKVRELNCHFEISKIFEESDDELHFIMEKVTKLIHESLNYPVDSSIRISLDEVLYNSNVDACEHLIIEVPIKANKQRIGSIALYHNTNRISDIDDERFIVSIADRIGFFIEKILAKDEVKKLERELLLISEHERQEIGQNLHDGLGQLLTGISFIIKKIQLRTERNEFDNASLLKELAGLAKDATIQCRQLAHGLTPVLIGDEGLTASLDQLACMVREIYNINCVIDIQGSTDIIDSFTLTQLYLIIKEAVNNGIKHGNPQNIYIKVINEGKALVLNVKNDGSVIVSGKNDITAMGMGIMKYRADLISARFLSGNAGHTGFFVEITLPLENIKALT